MTQVEGFSSTLVATAMALVVHRHSANHLYCDGERARLRRMQTKEVLIRFQIQSLELDRRGLISS